MERAARAVPLSFLLRSTQFPDTGFQRLAYKSSSDSAKSPRFGSTGLPQLDPSSRALLALGRVAPGDWSLLFE